MDREPPAKTYPGSTSDDRFREYAQESESVEKNDSTKAKAFSQLHRPWIGGEVMIFYFHQPILTCGINQRFSTDKWNTDHPDDSILNRVASAIHGWVVLVSLEY